MDAPPVQYARTSDGYDIAYVSSGEGRPLIVMPGHVHHTELFWRSEVYRPGYVELGDRFHLLQYDARGQALSSRGLREDLKPEDWALDVEAIVARERLDHHILYATTLSAYAAVVYSLRYPETVDALILWNVPLHRRTSVPSSMDQLAEENWEFFLDAVGRMVLPWEDPANAAGIVRKVWTQEDWLLRARLWRSVTIEESLKRIEVPTLVMTTRAGAWRFATEQDSRRIAALIPDARLVVFDDAGGGFMQIGDSPLSGPQVIEDFMREVNARSEKATVSDERDPGLTSRETEILRLVAAGKSNREIATELVISINTVTNHVKSILSKTGAANRTEAANYAYRHRLV
jgi:DNA-binding CsgD family transcriptional regulator/pimeloyl-ACP methyl ester carboxylesterase